MGIGRVFGKCCGLFCIFIVVCYRFGVMNVFEMDSNVDKGLFLFLYCNVDKDEGLMLIGYLSIFF